MARTNIETLVVATGIAGLVFLAGLIFAAVLIFSIIAGSGKKDRFTSQNKKDQPVAYISSPEINNLSHF